ncbi:MAG: hypothetical protein R3281_15275, partial [Balneolaceae bacterium]|nr:hypothetical protein [Balneolaceae bacterium]
MSEETKAMLDFEYEDQFSYLSEKGELMLKETSLFEERKIAEITDKEDLNEKLVHYEQTFDQLKEKVNAFIEQEEQNLEAFDNLIAELKGSAAIGDFEALHRRLQDQKKALINDESPADEAGTEETKEPEDSAGEEREKSEEEQSGIDYYRNLVKKAESLSKQ